MNKTRKLLFYCYKFICVNVYHSLQVSHLKKLLMLPCLPKCVVYPEVELSSLWRVNNAFSTVLGTKQNIALQYYNFNIYLQVKYIKKSMTFEKTIKEFMLDIIYQKKEWCTFECVSERIWHNMPQLWISCLRDHYHMLSRWSWLDQFHTSWAMQTCGTWDCEHKKGITTLQLLYIK